MSEPRQYVPSCWCRGRKTSFGEVLSLDFKADDLVEFIKRHRTEKGYLKLTISPMKNPTENATHSVYLNDWKPNPNREQSKPAPKDSNAGYPPTTPQEDSEIPF